MAKKAAHSADAIRDFQDKKNHQDFVYETNTQIQRLNHAVSALSLLVEKLRANSESDHKALLIELENFKASVLPRCQRVESRMGDLEIKVHAHIQRINRDHQDLKSIMIDKDTVMLFIGQHLKKIEENAESIKACKADLHLSINGQVAESNRYLSTQRLELLDLILREDPFKQEIADKLKVYKQDFDSLYQEMTNLKLAFGSVQKKFEHALRIELQQEVKQ